MAPIGVSTHIKKFRSLRRSDPVRNFTTGMRKMLSERTTKVYFSFLLFITSLGVFGPYLAPYGPEERVRTASGGLARLEPPSLANPLGTTDAGFDVLSRILVGARPTVVAGFLGGILIISIGLSIGLTSGYLGGRVDGVLMRFTDIVYGVPLLPSALVLVAIIGVGYFQTIFIIGIILWRGSARVIRSQVLQIRERPFILAAKATGASDTRIVLRHILPNVAPMAVLFFALGTGYTIILLASLAFLGVTSPFVPSWGVIIRNAYNSAQIGQAWWWSILPGLLISLTVLSLFMFGRGYEQIASADEEEADEFFAQAG